MKLSIITINFRTPSVTLGCLDSIYTCYEKKFAENDWEFLIVDNDSGDDSVVQMQQEIKKKKYKNVQIIANKKNSGFGGGNNFGATFAKGETLLFLNNDTHIVSGLDSMLSFFATHPDMSILGAPLTNTDGSSQVSTGTFYSLFQVFLVLLGMQRLGLHKNPTHITRVDWVKGALLMIRRELFERLHGFDEKIFMYTEDMELCYRANVLGKKTYFYPDITVIHAEHGSSSRTFAIVNIYAGIMYFYTKHKSAEEQLFVKLLLQSKAHLLVLLGKLFKNSYLVKTYEKALSVI